MDSEEPLLSYLRSRYTPLHLPLELGYPIEVLVALAITGTGCIANRQTDILRDIQGGAKVTLPRKKLNIYITAGPNVLIFPPRIEACSHSNFIRARLVRTFLKYHY